MLIRFIILSWVCFFFVVPVAHAETLSYKGVIKDVLDISARLRVKTEETDIAHASYRLAFAQLYPMISVSSRTERYENLNKSNQEISTIYGEVVGGNQSEWRSMLYISGQYDLSSWYKQRFDAAYYKKLMAASIFDCETETKKLILDITDIFSRLAEARIKLKRNKEILKKQKNILQLKQHTFSQGEAAYEDVLKTESEITSNFREEADITRVVSEQLARLSSYTGKRYSDNSEIEILQSSGTEQIVDINQLIAATPEYKTRYNELEALRFKAKSINNNYLPDITLYGRYDYYGSSENGLDRSFHEMRETGYSAGLFVTLPLFDGGAKKWERIKNRHEIKRQEEYIKAVMEEKTRDILTVYSGYSETAKAVEHWRKLSAQYARLLAIAEQAFRLGQRSRSDILELEKDALGVGRDLAVTESALAFFEKRLFAETDFINFMSEHYGNRTCCH